MVSLLTFVILAIALVCVFYRKRKTAIVFLALFFLSLFLFGTQLATNALIHSLQGDYLSQQDAKWAKKNLIMVLGMGTSEVGPGVFEPAPLSYGRIAHAAIAYKSCVSAGSECSIIVSGGPTNHKEASEAKIYALALKQLGVPEGSLILESESVSTWANAKNCSDIAKLYPDSKTFLVTSGIHMRRALLYYSHFGLNPDPIRADHIEAWPTFFPLAYNFSLADVALAEYRGLARYRIYNALGLNSTEPKAPPGAASPIP